MSSFDQMLAVLPKALEGWLGVFIVIAALILVIVLLNRLTVSKKKKDGDSAETN